MVLTRPPLESIGMNGAGTSKRRSARLSQESGGGENEPPSKKAKTNGASAATSVSTKQQDGGAKPTSKRKQKGTGEHFAPLAACARANIEAVYEEDVEGFTFSKGKRKKPAKEAAPTEPEPETAQPAPAAEAAPVPAHQPAPLNDNAPKTAQKTRRRLPTTPERDVVEKSVRRSKRHSDEPAPAPAPRASPRRPGHARSHANTERSPSPAQARPLTVEKKRKEGSGVVEEEKVMRIMLPFADTPIIRRNREMRKGSAEGNRRSSSGLRGRRASSLIDEGRGNGESTRLLSEYPSELRIHGDVIWRRGIRGGYALNHCGLRHLLDFERFG